jgi:hypothetical protein
MKAIETPDEHRQTKAKCLISGKKCRKIRIKADNKNKWNDGT